MLRKLFCKLGFHTYIELFTSSSRLDYYAQDEHCRRLNLICSHCNKTKNLYHKYIIKKEF